MAKFPDWSKKLKTIENGWISDYQLKFMMVVVIYKRGEKFFKEKTYISAVDILRKYKDFRYANVYDIASRKQIASMTKTSSKWFVKKYKSWLMPK